MDDSAGIFAEIGFVAFSSYSGYNLTQDEIKIRQNCQYCQNDQIWR